MDTYEVCCVHKNEDSIEYCVCNDIADHWELGQGTDLEASGTACEDHANECYLDGNDSCYRNLLQAEGDDPVVRMSPSIEVVVGASLSRPRCNKQGVSNTLL